MEQPTLTDLQLRVRRRRESRQAAADAPPPAGEARVVLALDYGTTFTGVAYARGTGRDDVDPENIYIVQQWPGKEKVKVPSEFSYSRTPQFLKQFGYDIDDESEILAKTKLELEDQHDDRLRELKAFSQTLFGLASLELSDHSAIGGKIPKHLTKNAEDIIQDYLDKVADVVYADMTRTLGRHVPDVIPST